MSTIGSIHEPEEILNTTLNRFRSLDLSPEVQQIVAVRATMRVLPLIYNTGAPSRFDHDELRNLVAGLNFAIIGLRTRLGSERTIGFLIESAYRDTNPDGAGEPGGHTRAATHCAVATHRLLQSEPDAAIAEAARAIMSLETSIVRPMSQFIAALQADIDHFEADAPNPATDSLDRPLWDPEHTPPDAIATHIEELGQDQATAVLSAYQSWCDGKIDWVGAGSALEEWITEKAQPGVLSKYDEDLHRIGKLQAIERLKSARISDYEKVVSEAFQLFNLDGSQDQAAIATRAAQRVMLLVSLGNHPKNWEHEAQEVTWQVENALHLALCAIKIKPREISHRAFESAYQYLTDLSGLDSPDLYSDPDKPGAAGIKARAACAAAAYAATLRFAEDITPANAIKFAAIAAWHQKSLLPFSEVLGHEIESARPGSAQDLLADPLWAGSTAPTWASPITSEALPGEPSRDQHLKKTYFTWCRDGVDWVATTDMATGWLKTNLDNKNETEAAREDRDELIRFELERIRMIRSREELAEFSEIETYSQTVVTAMYGIPSSRKKAIFAIRALQRAWILTGHSGGLECWGGSSSENLGLLEVAIHLAICMAIGTPSGDGLQNKPGLGRLIDEIHKRLKKLSDESGRDPTLGGYSPSIESAMCAAAAHAVNIFRQSLGNEVAVPNIKLIDQHGKSVRLDSDVLGNNVVAMNFLCTSCETCRQMGANFTRLSDQLTKDDQKLVSVIIDPETDQSMARAKSLYGGSRWTLLGGSKPEIDQLLSSHELFSTGDGVHKPFTLISYGAKRTWIRVDGPTSHDNLLAMMEENFTSEESLETAATVSQAISGVWAAAEIEGEKCKQLFTDALKLDFENRQTSGAAASELLQQPIWPDDAMSDEAKAFLKTVRRDFGHRTADLDHKQRMIKQYEAWERRGANLQRSAEFVTAWLQCAGVDDGAMRDLRSLLLGAHSAVRAARPEAWVAGDAPTSIDRLGMKAYVDALADVLEHEQTKLPLTVSIEGEWGTGKTSFMKQLQRSLEGDVPTEKKGFGRKALGRVASVWFNPWRHESAESMWMALAEEMVRQLKAERTVPWRLRQWLKVHYRIALLGIGGSLAGVAWSLSAIPWEGFQWSALFSDHLRQSVGLFSSVATLIMFGAWFWNGSKSPRRLLSKLKSTRSYAKQISFVEQFHKDFAKIVKLYSKNRRCVVFIDDLDRCEARVASDLLQAINLLVSHGHDESNEAKVIFVVAVNREKVAAGFAQKSEHIIPYLYPGAEGERRTRAARDFGFEFMEKFIQLPFRVPLTINPPPEFDTLHNEAPQV